MFESIFFRAIFPVLFIDLWQDRQKTHPSYNRAYELFLLTTAPRLAVALCPDQFTSRKDPMGPLPRGGPMLNQSRIFAKFCLLVCVVGLLGGCFGRSSKIQAPAPFSYPQQDWVLTVGDPIEIPAPEILGPVPLGWAVDPQLPAGLSFNEDNGSISGIPQEPCPRNFFTVTASNFGGQTSYGISIRVLPEAPCDLAYPVTEVTGVLAFAEFPTLVPSVGCGGSNDYSIDPALPEGLLLDMYTGIISGTPLISHGPQEHQITASNESGSAATSLLIEILPAGPCGLVYEESDKVVAPNADMDPILPTVGCGEADLWEINPSLPAGVTLDPATGVINGNPSVETNRIVYTITASNEHGSDSTEVALRISPVFIFEIDQLSGSFNPETGEGGAQARIILTEGEDNETFPTQIQLLSLALAHDPESLDVTSVEPGEDLAGLNGGDGPDFFTPFETSTGFTLGIVFSFSPDFPGISAETPTEIAVVNYVTVPENTSGDADSILSSLAWGNPVAGQPGVPYVENTVVLDGVTGILPVTIDNNVELIAETSGD